MSSGRELALSGHASLIRWTRINLAYLALVTLTGAIVRLTGSGLGCTDWPTCEANTVVVEVSFHSFIEFGNRIISGLAIVPVIVVWRLARQDRSELKGWLVALIIGFFGQVLLGMLVTRTELDPRVVLGHFLLSIVLVWLAVQLDLAARRETPIQAGLGSAARYALLALISAVIVVGTLVTGSGPHTGSDDALEPVPRLGFDISEITRIHSVLVWCTVALLAWMFWKVRESSPAARKRLTIVIALAAAQGAVGYVQFFTGVPVVLVAFHIIGAVLVFIAVSSTVVRLR